MEIKQKDKPNKIIRSVFAFGACVFILAQPANANSCTPGSISYKKSHLAVIRNFSSQPENTAMNATSGRVSISPINEEVIEISPNGYKSRITLRSTYGQVADEFGLKVRKTVYILETNQSCDDFNIVSVTSEPLINFGIPNVSLSLVSKAALESYIASLNVVPDNSHSGDYTIRIHNPELCSDGQNATVNIVRINHQPTGLMHRTTSALVDLNSGIILKTDVRPGQILRSLCI